MLQDIFRDIPAYQYMLKDVIILEKMVANVGAALTLEDGTTRSSGLVRC